MDFPKSNDAKPNGGKPNGGIPDGSGTTTNGGAHGRAALFLTESLMHLLLSRGVISREDFIEIVEDAAEAECGTGGLQRSSQSDFGSSLLYPLAASFRRELGR